MPASPRKSAKSAPGAFNLTKATEVGRNVVKFGGIVLIILMVGRLLVNGITAFWIATHPEPPPPPTQGYGPLPEISFGNEGATVRPKLYQLELPGAFPTFSDRAGVYFLPKDQIGLLSLEATKAHAARLGFQSEPAELDDDDYRWNRSGIINATLEMNTVTKNFVYATDYLSRPEVQAVAELPNTFDAVQTVKQFLSSTDLLPADMATVAGETQFLKIAGGALKPAVSLSDAQVIRVDLFRTPLEGFPTYSADGKTGMISATVASLNGQPTVIALTRSYAPIDYSTVHTYPLRTAQEAWQLLKAGQGYIAQARREDSAIIRSVSLGYFESMDQMFMQPIFVFTGDDDFIGYVSALDSSAQTAQPAPPQPTPTPSQRPGVIGL